MVDIDSCEDFSHLECNERVVGITICVIGSDDSFRLVVSILQHEPLARVRLVLAHGFSKWDKANNGISTYHRGDSG